MRGGIDFLDYLDALESLKPLEPLKPLDFLESFSLRKVLKPQSVALLHLKTLY